MKNHYLGTDSSREARRCRIKSLALLCGSFLLLAGNARSQIVTDGFEGVVVSGASANSGGTTGNPNLGITSSSWSTTGSFTTFAGQAPTAATALSLSNSTASTQTWTWTIPVGCYQAAMSQLSFDYRSTTTSYKTIAITINGTTVYTNSALNNNGSFQSILTPTFSVTATTPITVVFTFGGGTHGSGGTFRLDNVKLFGTVSPNPTSCTGTPAGGSLAADSSVFCGSGATTLTLTGAAEGCFISHQLQQSTTSPTSGFSDVAGATGTFYSTGMLSGTTYYRVYTRCGTSGLADTTAPVTVTVNTPPTVAAITGLNAGPLVVGSTDALADATSGGTWSSSNSSIVSVDASGVISGIAGGTAIISYTVAGTSGCNGKATQTVNVAWPNTLALYAGSGGTSTGVIAAANATASALTATGFSNSTPCTSGGLSGLTVDTLSTSYSPSGPHVFYVVKPVAGKALNVTRIAAKIRVTGAGPQYAKIAYSLNGGATWIADSAKALSRTGSCGNSANQWSYGDPGMTGDVTINGITDSLLVAVYPYFPTAAGSNFQLNFLEVYGTVTDTAVCGTLANSGSVLPARVNICQSGSRWLNYDVVNGASGPGISYQWQVSSTSATSGFSDIAGATNASYNTGTLTAPVLNYYRVKVLCSLGGTNFSAADTVTVSNIPAVSFSLPADPFFLKIGSPVDLTAVSSVSPTGGWWSSDNVSSTSVDSATGLATGHIPGFSRLTYHVTTSGCTGIARDTVFAVHDSTLAVYLGMNGNSQGITTNSDLAQTAPFTKSGYDSANACARGGISGMVNAATSYNAASGPWASFAVTNANVFDPVFVNSINATVRRSGTGPNKVRLAYRIAPSTTWIDNGDATVLADDCGYSSNEIVFDLSAAPVMLNPGDVVEVGLQAYNGGAGGAFQINSASIIGTGVNSPVQRQAAAAVRNVIAAGSIKLYPNPAGNVLHIDAAETVNVTVLSLDGKVLIRKNGATEINVTGLTSGLYLVQVYDAGDHLIQTAKFSKQ